MQAGKYLFAFVLAILLGCSEAGATCAALPYTFVNGTLANAIQVNGNFTTLLNCMNGTSITTLGTVTSGTWQATKIGLAYGGTNADLSATGGTSQVLQQASAGAAITVGQLAASALSNGTSGTGGVVLQNNSTLGGTTTLNAVSAVTLAASGQASVLGNAAGSKTSPTNANTNLLLYNNSSTNYAGMGAHTAGDIYFVTGTSAPATRMVIDPSGNLQFNHYGAGALYTDASGNVSAAVAASALVSPSNPTSTSSGTLTHAGLQNGATTITPARTGRILISIKGTGANSTGNCGLAYQVRYGTGTGPANAAPATGTAIGSNAGVLVNPTTPGSIGIPFEAGGVVSGLTIGQGYWVDLTQATFSGACGTANVANVTISAVEI